MASVVPAALRARLLRWEPPLSLPSRRQRSSAHPRQPGRPTTMPVAAQISIFCTRVPADDWIPSPRNALRRSLRAGRVVD